MAASLSSSISSKTKYEYKEEGWGIFDDTSDMNRSVRLSDAYYGDGSSMVWLYQKAGKLAMIQDVDIIEEE